MARMSARSSSASSLTSSYFTMSTAPTQQMSALSLGAEKRASDQIKALDLKGLREKAPQSSGTASQVSALLERKAKARSKVSVSSITVSDGQVTRQTGTSFPAQACTNCGYQTFQGDKFCGGCGARLLTRKEFEEALAKDQEAAADAPAAAPKSGSAVGTQLSHGSRSRLSRTASGLLEPAAAAQPPAKPRDVPPFAPTQATPASTLKGGSMRNAPTEPTAPAPAKPAPEAKTLEAKLAEGAAKDGQRKRAPAKPGKRTSQKSISNWRQREEWIGTQWTKLMKPRGPPEGPVLRPFNPPEPPLGRAPKDGEW